jgi:tRNA modification GTPase
VSQSIQIEGVPLHVVDTAGLRESEDPVEKIGIERAWERITGADAVLFLHDLSRLGEVPYQTDDARIRATLAERLPAQVPVIEVFNKQDLAPAALPDGGLALSARTGEGLAALRARLLEVAGWQSAPEGVWLARERHVQALGRVRDHLQAAHDLLAAQASALDLMAEELRLGQNALGEITGEFTADDLLGVIFSKFCIGK